MKTETIVGPEYVLSVLTKYGFEKVKRSTEGYTACCKFHNERTPSFSINANGLWCCFGCGAKGNIKQLHQRLGGNITLADEIKILSARLSSKAPRAKVKAKAALLDDFELYTKDTVPEYISSRIGMPTIKNFRLGKSDEGMNKNRCIIPIYDKYKVVGYHARALNNKMEPRYYNSPGFNIKDYLFNFDGCRDAKEVIVMEGAFNVMSMFEKGFKNCVATFGTKFTQEQVRKLFTLSPERIVICFDRDSSAARPGQRAAVSLARLTYQLIPTFIMPLPMDKDANDLSPEVLLSCYQNKTEFEKVK